MGRWTRNGKGHSVLELLVALSLVAAALGPLLAAFLGATEGIAASWQRTEQVRVAASVVEALKGMPYRELLHGYKALERGGRARLDPRNPPFSLSLDPSFAAYEIQLELSPYRGYGAEEMLQAVVRVREDGKEPWREMATLLSRGGASHYGR